MEPIKAVVNFPNALYPALFGKLDENILKLENTFSVNIVNRGEEIVIVGLSQKNVKNAESVLLKLLHMAEKGENIDEQKVNYLMASLDDDAFDQIDKLNEDVVCMTVAGKPIKPKTLGQKKYLEQIRKNIIVFGVGPAGTGKTYLAMAAAIAAFRKNEVSRIILTRPAIEAGEKLGFLPGDLQQKVDPYLRPLYDAIYEIMGAEAYQRNLEKNAIEVAPLAYMRGRTLDNAFIVLDEAQNTTPEQMKMLLTRIGYNSKIVVTGDVTQIDLPEGKRSGLVDAVATLHDIEDISIVKLSGKDVVRHPLIQKIIIAYEKKASKIKVNETRKKEMRERFKGKGRVTK